MTEKQVNDDYDSPWKEVLENYFEEFIAFFFPDAYNDTDWERGYEFLDKELQQITRDAEAGRKYVDRLARVWLKTGDEAWALIHSDIQIRRENDFDERMYMYNYRLYDRYRRHAASFAVIGDKGQWRPGGFDRRLWGCEIRFRFPVVRLADYGGKRNALRESGNPFATVVLAHLHTQETAGNGAGRRREKMALIRHMYQKNFSRQDIINLFRFIDWIMHLPEAEEKLFWEELADFEEERKMPYITSVERIGYKRGVEEGIGKGMQQGIRKGMKQGESLMLAKMVSGKFGIRQERVLTLIRPLSSEELGELADSFFGFENFDVFCEWVRKRTAGRTGQ